jgi:hypothetical protein
LVNNLIDFRDVVSQLQDYWFYPVDDVNDSDPELLQTVMKIVDLNSGCPLFSGLGQSMEFFHGSLEVGIGILETIDVYGLFINRAQDYSSGAFTSVIL